MISRQSVLTLYLGASFDNWLDAVDGSFCTFQGGDNPNFVSHLLPLKMSLSHLRIQDGIYPDRQRGGFKGAYSICQIESH